MSEFNNDVTTQKQLREAIKKYAIEQHEISMYFEAGEEKKGIVEHEGEMCVAIRGGDLFGCYYANTDDRASFGCFDAGGDVETSGLLENERGMALKACKKLNK